MFIATLFITAQTCKQPRDLSVNSSLFLFVYLFFMATLENQYTAKLLIFQRYSDQLGLCNVIGLCKPDYSYYSIHSLSIILTISTSFLVITCCLLALATSRSYSPHCIQQCSLMREGCTIIFDKQRVWTQLSQCWGSLQILFFVIQ